MFHDEKDLPGDSRICVYGAGSRAARLLRRLAANRPDLEVACVVDSFSDGGMFEGLPLRNVAHLAEETFDYLVVSAYRYDEVVRTLSARGLSPRYYVHVDCDPPAASPELLTAPPRERRQVLDQFEALSRRRTGQVNVTLTNACNSRCVFCAYPGYTEPRAVMTREHFARLASSMAAHGELTMDFSPLIGESLLDPGLADKIRHARQAGIQRLLITSNGLLLGRDEALLQLLLSECETISVSTPGLSREAYRRIFRVDAFRQVLDGLRQVAAVKRRLGGGAHVNLCLRSPRPPQAALDDEGFRELLPFIKEGLLFFDPGDGCVEFDNWSGALVAGQLPEGLRLKPPAVTPGAPPCDFILRGACTALPDGSLRLCPCRFLETLRDDLVIADPDHPDPLAALHGPRHERIVLDWLDGRLPRACAGCSLYRPCAEQNT
ncbi:Coenzyme PQQ synthesis protein E [Fundidesulfovibrio magnetotacticus]|uniref:Coenzyme PQQ synthesis protein E n=1 Tax=Fundidesulfovibrio magnetotacticus TaxID=2730080 RepID=A0A6V8LWE9_9BACT|nr:radical SAM protein [Fundidesulfovibrio magnetotacticus]GFK94931.1 Coenzyme PQQ synthesis protein E [Fundidesulfovibrio magnetotacticus]